MKPLTPVEWLIVFVAVLGFAFDIYELLMLPIIARPALSDLLHVPPDHPLVLEWIGYLFWIPAICGGVFGLIGGWLTDRFGRRRVLVWSILVYAGSAFAAGWSQNAGTLLFFRCTTFIGVCVEFVAATAWLAELFPERERRERILGWTQAASSVGGLMVTGANMLAVHYAYSLPAIHGGHASWRYTLMSGIIPAIPLIFVRPFLPESPLWKAKVAEGAKLARPAIWEIFRADLRRTTLVSTLLMATSYAAAFGGLQMVPQIVPGLLPEAIQLRQQARALGGQAEALAKEQAAAVSESQRQALAAQVSELRQSQQALNRKAGPMEQQKWNRTQLIQELGGLTGRVLFAILTVIIISRRLMLRTLQIPALLFIPFVFLVPGTSNYQLLNWGIFFAGLLVVAQFSFYGNYLPQVFPTRLRGTGEGFSVNVGGRMIGTSAALLTTQLAQSSLFGDALGRPARIAYAAACVVGGAYLIGIILTFLMPDPKDANLDEGLAGSTVSAEPLPHSTNRKEA